MHPQCREILTEMPTPAADQIIRQRLPAALTATQSLDDARCDSSSRQRVRLGDRTTSQATR
ncbi:MAG: hypothetical protein BGO26_20840 [Actinobacteria bacterium 69-20]|nr:MAG: hypothetical protein BGO26_20840 [Actinobacteria bacterium 69-20]